MRAILVAIGCLALGCGGSKSSDSTCEDADGDGVTTCDGDCNDEDALAKPDGNEICGDNVDNNCDGAKEEGCPGGVGTFVSAAIGDDANPGTKASPLKTIAAGIANATAIGGPQTVVVGEGTYAEKVSISEGIDLLGGFQCDASSCGWMRDLAVHESVIQNTDLEGVLAAAGVTSATLFEGFHVVGLDGLGRSAAVTLGGGAPTVSRNKLVGGNVGMTGSIADVSAALVIASTADPAGALIEANELTGGRAASVSAGIYITGGQPGSLATIRSNSIRGGEAQHTAGIIAFNSLPGTLVVDNTIHGGTSPGGMPGSQSHGIEVHAQMTIERNRINVDAAKAGVCTNTRNWCAGIASISSTSTIVNNIVLGPKAQRSAAILLGEFEVAAGAVVLNSNLLDGGGGVPAGTGTPTESAAVVVQIGPCNNCGFNGRVGRVRNNILLGGANQLRFGVREDPAQGKTMHPEELENNLFHFAPLPGPARADVMVLQMTPNGPKQLRTIAEVNMITTPMAKANVAGDPLVDSTWHIGNTSPCVNAGTATESPVFDFEGQARPNGDAPDIGHDEL